LPLLATHWTARLTTTAITQYSRRQIITSRRIQLRRRPLYNAVLVEWVLALADDDRAVLAGQLAAGTGGL
jgi:hypothetical protein